MLFTGSFVMLFFTQVPLDLFFQFGLDFLFAGSYTEEALGGNYWHCWLDAKPPRYKVWLDGLYMAQPFLARQASVMRDRAALERIARRFF